MRHTAPASLFQIRQFEDRYVKSGAAGAGRLRGARFHAPVERHRWRRGVSDARLHLRFATSSVSRHGREGAAAHKSRRPYGKVLCNAVAIRPLNAGPLGDVLGLPAALQAAFVDQNPMTCQPRWWRPTLARGTANNPQVVVGMFRLKPMRRHAPQAETFGIRTSECCVSCEHRSPPLPRFARQVGERDGQLGATANPHAANAGAIHCCVLR